MRKIYLSPERRPAPHGKYWGYNQYEHDYCVDIAKRMTALLSDFEVKIAADELVISDRVKEAKRWEADYYMPIHTNASTDGSREGTAQGALGLCKDETQSKIASQAVFDRLNALRPSTRGIATSQFLEIRDAPCVVSYPEIAFHDNGKDAEYLVLHRQAIAEALADGIRTYFKASKHTEQDYQELYADYDCLKTRLRWALECAENGRPDTNEGGE
jgi:N-acetylmuramoyl-L-alanine amidase